MSWMNIYWNLPWIEEYRLENSSRWLFYWVIAVWVVRLFDEHIILIITSSWQHGRPAFIYWLIKVHDVVGITGDHRIQRELLLKRERGLNRNTTCIWYVEVWELKLYFYQSAGGVARSCSGFCQVRVRRHKSARGRDDVIWSWEKVDKWIGFWLILFLS